MKMAERIRRARHKTGLSQAALADRLHVQRSAVSNWESVNDIQPSLHNLISLAKLCEISFEWLGTGRGTMTSDIDFLNDIPAAQAEVVDVAEERELLAMFRNLPTRSQHLVIDLVDTLHSSRVRSKRADIAIRATKHARGTG